MLIDYNKNFHAFNRSSRNPKCSNPAV